MAYECWAQDTCLQATCSALSLTFANGTDVSMHRAAQSFVVNFQNKLSCHRGFENKQKSTHFCKHRWFILIYFSFFSTILLSTFYASGLADVRDSSITRHLQAQQCHLLSYFMFFGGHLPPDKCRYFEAILASPWARSLAWRLLWELFCWFLWYNKFWHLRSTYLLGNVQRRPEWKFLETGFT